MRGALSSTDPYTANAAVPRVIPEREQQIVRDVLQEFSQMYSWRNSGFSGQWEEVASLIDPPSRNTFFYGAYNTPGQKKTHQQVDSSGQMALHRFAAICDSMLTPRNMQWHQLRANNDYVMKDRLTRLWFEQATNILFKYRYAAVANFTGQNQNNWRGVGAYGNAAMFVDALDTRLFGGARGLRYKAVPMGEMYWRENHQGQIDGFIRWFKLTAAQAAQKWGIARLPVGLHTALSTNSQFPYQFLHCVRPREDYDPQRYDARALPYGSYYVSIEGQCLMAPESGYRSLPIAAFRYDEGPGEVYGRGPAMMVLPALKTLNAQKATFLKQGHRASDPVLLTTDDGLTNFSLRPGAMNPGAMSAEGKRLVDVLPTGNIATNEKMMDMERSLIDDAFLVSLFKLILEEKVLTATQVTEIVNQKGILIAPTMGKLQTGLGQMIDRELDVLAAQGLLPPMPPRLREAKGDYRVEYTSPLARTQRAGEAAGFMRTVETAKEIANITQDPAYLDPFDFDVALPDIADIQGVPESWMAAPDKIAARRKARAKAQQQQAAIQALPAQAAMMKAQATVQKNQPGIGPNQGIGGPQQGP